jgi:hypothetical protein
VISIDPFWVIPPELYLKGSKDYANSLANFWRYANKLNFNNIKYLTALKRINTAKNAN